MDCLLINRDRDTPKEIQRTALKCRAHTGAFLSNFKEQLCY